ncbi:site-2 protease family protein [Chitinasiproducens palmae]|uniref:Zn-dependent protease (Includes SpoIVFB) n=1 Tax=Chitinasiproducens palmae TaxID=1770053 RepID=A0A1H2PR74_9BURK|nr:site-2 protease family protein [Chitinasiproducens palmae]SDV49302.1 Zn-dependent protease (includes SpoIVFB) [Chitinasiproducens palmae]
MFDNLIQNLAVYALPVLFAITLHEAAHAYAARLFGDSTAYMLGRVSLNPARHIDPLGTIAMPVVLYLLTGGAFLFGYAKPVPVMFDRLRNPRWHAMLVAAAGPASNLVQSLLWGILALGLQAAGVQEAFFVKMASAGVLVNLVIAAFNLFPLPPLDGGRIVTSLLPARQAITFGRLEPFGFIIVMVLVMTHVFVPYWLSPLVNVFYGFVNLLLTPLVSLVALAH